MQHFPNNFITKKAGNILDFGIKVIDQKDKETEFADGEKKFRNFFDWIFSMNRINRNKKRKNREEHIEDVLINPEKTHQIFKSQYKTKIRQYKNTLGF